MADRPPPEQDPDPSDPIDPRGNVRPTGPGPLVVAGAVAMLLGWGMRRLSLRQVVPDPVTVWSVLFVWVIAIAVGIVAYRTWRVLQRPKEGTQPLEGYQAVNRLVLGKAAAILGAFVVGGYAGYAIAFLGVPRTELTAERLIGSGIAALGGVAVLVGGLLLERACRVRRKDDSSLR